MLSPDGLCTVTSSLNVRLRPAYTSPYHSADAGAAVSSSRHMTITEITTFIGSSLFRLDLSGGGRVARDRGAAHVAWLALVVAAHAVHHLAVVPHDEIPYAPLVDVDELRPGGVLVQVFQQDPRLRHRHPGSRARAAGRRGPGSRRRSCRSAGACPRAW